MSTMRFYLIKLKNHVYRSSNVNTLADRFGSWYNVATANNRHVLACFERNLHKLKTFKCGAHIMTPLQNVQEVLTLLPLTHYTVYILASKSNWFIIIIVLNPNENKTLTGMGLRHARRHRLHCSNLTTQTRRFHVRSHRYWTTEMWEPWVPVLRQQLDFYSVMELISHNCNAI